MAASFEISGYNIEYYYDGYYYGCNRKLKKPDRKEMGYFGRQKETLKEDWVYKSKKLKAGTVVFTECVPVCGKLKKQ